MGEREPQRRSERGPESNDDEPRPARWREAAVAVRGALGAGVGVGALVGAAMAWADLGLVDGSLGDHQVHFVAATVAAWTVVGVGAALAGVLLAAGLHRLGAARIWSGWFVLAAWLAIDVGHGSLGLDEGVEVVALLALVGALLAGCAALGRRVPVLESPILWTAVAGAWLLAGVFELAGSTGATAGIGTLARIELAVLGLVVSLPFVAARPRAAGIGAQLVVAAALAALPSLGLATPPESTDVGTARRRGERPLNVLLVTLDTLRADSLGSYGAPDAITPSLDAFAETGVLFEQVQSPVPMTYPAHTTMLTGLEPGNHGVVNNMPWPVPWELESLPDLLASELGYRTAAFVSGFTLKRDASRLFQRFAVYDETFSPLRVVPDAFVDSSLVTFVRDVGERLGLKLRTLRYGGDRPAERTVDSALEWLDSRTPGEPFFLWVHLFDPHLPYEPPSELARRHDPDYRGNVDGFWYRVSPERKREIVTSDREAVDHLRALYRAEITYADEQIGRLLGALSAQGLDDDTLVVFTSDHGESLGEHDYWFDHSYFLYQTCLAVPLMVRLPAGHGGVLPPGTRVEDPVRLVDLAPTIAELVGLPGRLGEVDGVSLVPLFDGQGVPEGTDRAWAVTYDLRQESRRFLLAVRDGRWKYVRLAERWDDLRLRPAEEELYDLERDPRETVNLLRDEPEVLERMRALARDRVEAWGSVDPAGADALGDETRERLEGIGYL